MTLNKLAESIECGDLLSVALVLERIPDINQEYVELDGVTPLVYAVVVNQLGVATLILERGAQVNVADLNGRTAMFYVQSTRMIELLMGHGASISTLDIHGMTPLHILVRDHKYDEIEYLIAMGADIDAKAKNGMAPIEFAFGSDMCFRLLAERGADLKIVNYLGWTLLHTAAHKGTYNMLSLLIDQGADAFVIDHNGNTALDLAIQEENTFCIDLLKSAMQKKGWQK